MGSVTIKVRRAAALGPKGPTGTPGHGGQREGETMEGEEEEEGGEGSPHGRGEYKEGLENVRIAYIRNCEGSESRRNNGINPQHWIRLSGQVRLGVRK
jgi:hypothetical protein